MTLLGRCEECNAGPTVELTHSLEGNKRICAHCKQKEWDERHADGEI